MDAARVEADALADDGQVASEGVLLPLAAGAHHDHPGRVVTPLPDREEHAHAQLGGALGLDHVDPEVVLPGERARLLGQDLGRDVVRGPVGQPPCAVRAFAQDPAAPRPRS
jgi:hypothetical protein